MKDQWMTYFLVNDDQFFSKSLTKILANERPMLPANQRPKF
jgi:hypothetical protein